MRKSSLAEAAQGKKIEINCIGTLIRTEIQTILKLHYLDISTMTKNKRITKTLNLNLKKKYKA